MALTLSIENMPNLPDGGPLSFTVTGKRGFEFGREQYLDWTLPDPTRYISGKHCEVRFQNGEYLLYDVSTNGTFLNGSQNRMQSPHRLRTGDRLTVGDYIIAVVVEGESAETAEPPATPFHNSGQGLWDVDGAVAPPIDPRQLRPPGSSRPVRSDFLDQSINAGDLYGHHGGGGQSPFSAPAAPPPAADPDFSWAPPVPRAVAPVEAPPPAPTPRRVEPAARGDLWGADAAPAAASPFAEPAARAAPVEWSEPVARAAPVEWSEPAAGVAPVEWAEPAPAPVASPAVAPPSAPASAPSTWDAPPVVAAPIAAPVAPKPPPATPFEVSPPTPARAPASDAASADFIARFAAGLGLPAAQFANQDPLAVAQNAGEIMRTVVVNMMQLLSARNEAKRMARSANQTMIQALDNNPLKFSPTPEDALKIMLGPRTKSYLDANQALSRSFDDLKTHQVRTYSAMQAAVRMIAGELDPETIETSLPSGGGLAERLGSRKARLWEAYAARWRAKTEHHDDGLVDVFMMYFADCYDRDSDAKR